MEAIHSLFSVSYSRGSGCENVSLSVRSRLYIAKSRPNASERTGVRHRPVEGARQILADVDDIVPVQQVVKIELKAAVLIWRIG